MSIEVQNMFVFTKGNNKIKATATVKFNGMIISDIKLIEGRSGFFVGMPSRSYEKDGETKWVDIVRIEDESDREKLNEAVLNAFYTKRTELNMAPDGSRVKKSSPKTSAPAMKSDTEWFDDGKDKKSGDNSWEQGW